ncbi:cyclic nucleotide-binding domain-containing protein [Nisaea acidiphila]|uniref:Cyclic nucleotide-binding domain-containing protein n=1 Tax=Nisaea acidiphila TaxID=1862145 RepID=A0A9J7AP53_9PROT|nr:cyclic nucleotide-binding domain-containing protein [Nisaea acidiphila]UUX49192.1 cyclic nucleotide-binding domain-containing protein [Nisaea acidiphila]
MNGGRVGADDIALISIFQDLGAEERAAIASVCRKLHFRAGEPIISTGGADHDVYFMLDGEAEVVNHTIIGNALHLDALSAGAYFGELSALDGGPRSAEVQTLSDCVVAAMPPSEFRQVLVDYPSVLVLVLHNLAQMIRAANLTVLQHATI